MITAKHIILAQFMSLVFQRALLNTLSGAPMMPGELSCQHTSIHINRTTRPILENTLLKEFRWILAATLQTEMVIKGSLTAPNPSIQSPIGIDSTPTRQEAPEAQQVTIQAKASQNLTRQCCLRIEFSCRFLSESVARLLCKLGHRPQQSYKQTRRGLTISASHSMTRKAP